ncbi:MAG: hypothetical protein AAFX79_11850 [Planctomycetota bacterium]
MVSSDPPYGTAGRCANPRLNLLLSDASRPEQSWADRLPPLLEPMGVRTLRARSGTEATRVLAANPVHMAVVDLALPLDERSAEDGGLRLLELLRRSESPPPTIVIRRARTTREATREAARALMANAFAVIDRPSQHRDVELLLEVLRRVLARHYRGQWPGST